jgi:hypothetical protein
MIGSEGFRLANIRWRINKNDWQSAVREIFFQMVL